MSESSQDNILKNILVTLKYSENPILVDSNISWYGQEIYNLIESLFNKLNKLGIKKGDIVAIILENSVEYLVSVLSVWSCYATILPLNPLNHEVEISNFLTDANVSFVLYNNSSKTLIDKTKNILNRNQKCKEFLSDNKWLDVTINHAQKFFTNNTLNPSFSLSQISKLEENIPDFNKDDPMVLAYTSGTTGKSKAVIHSHENILTNASFIAKNWYGGLFGQKLLARNIEYQRILAVLPLTHNFGFNVTFLSALLHGGTILLMKRFSAVEVLRYAQDNKATVMPLVPTMFSAIFNNSERSRVSLSSMRLLISGGSAMPKTLRDLFQTAYPLATVIDTYGLSEASLVSCTPIDRTHPSGTIGYPIADTEISVRNDFGKIITDFSVGEFWIRGKSVISHYFKEESRNSFEKEGWFKTGDLGYLTKEGYFVLVDRKKDIIIHGGYNIYPLEIESVLYEHYAIDLCVVFGIPDFRFGEKVVACVVLKEHYLNTTSNDIIFHCKKYLASYKIPSFIAFRKELAKNHTGKILRRLVKEAFLSDLHDNSPSIGSK